MRAVAAPLHILAQLHQLRQLHRRQMIPRLDRRLARHHVQHIPQRMLRARPNLNTRPIQLPRLRRSQQLLDKLPHLHAALQQETRERLHPHLPIPHQPNLQPNPREQPLRAEQRRARRPARPHHHRHQKPLTFKIPSKHPLREVLKHRPLMQRMLIDDHHALLILRDDVRVVHLQQRRVPATDRLRRWHRRAHRVQAPKSTRRLGPIRPVRSRPALRLFFPSHRLIGLRQTERHLLAPG